LRAAPAADCHHRLEQQYADADDQRGLDETHQHVRNDLAEHHLDRSDRHRQQALHGAAFDSRVTEVR
jgi:hypothetical protein